MTRERKITPQAIDLEEAVLGAMLVDTRCVDEVMEILKPDVFYKKQHQLIFKAIRSLYDADENIDLLTVSNKLKQRKTLDKVGGDYYLIQLTKKVASSAHIENHSRILLQKYIQRELISNSQAIIEHCYDDSIDVFDLLDKAFMHLGSVSSILISNKEVNIRELTAEIVLDGGRLFRKEITPGIETPIKRLTETMGGWRNGELIVLAARPGMGKTAFALKCGWEAAKKEIPVGFFSMEMSSRKLLERIWSAECQIEGNKFNIGGLAPDEQRKITNRASELDDIPFLIDDTGKIDIQTLRTKAKRWKKDKGLRMLIVDYLQLMDGDSRNREQEISKISRGLKTIAMELDIPIIALSQLSRNVENRGGNKRPMLSDLRESGAIEQDADVVSFIYRPEYYGHKEWDDENRTSCVNQAEMIVAKNRNGGLLKTKMEFKKWYTLFSDLEEDDFVYAPIPSGSIEDAFEPTSSQPQVEREDIPF